MLAVIISIVSVVGIIVLVGCYVAACKLNIARVGVILHVREIRIQEIDIGVVEIRNFMDPNGGSGSGSTNP